MGKEQVLGVTKLVNVLFGKPAAALLALLAALHIQLADPQYPIPNFFAMELIVFLFGIAFFLWLKPRISADRPGATQQVTELLITNSMGVGLKRLDRRYCRTWGGTPHPTVWHYWHIHSVVELGGSCSRFHVPNG